MITSKKRSWKRQLSQYDIKSFLIQFIIVVWPYILASMNDVAVLLEQRTWDPHSTAIVITSIGLFIKKLMTDYELNKNK